MIRMEVISSFGTQAGSFTAGNVYRVPADQALSWVGAGLAHYTNRLTSAEQAMQDKLREGAGRSCLFLPFVGEFGHQVMSHIRLVHFSKAARKVVCCRRGDEVLYPSADQHITDWCDPIRDQFRVATMRSWQILWPQLIERFPHHVPISGASMTPDQELVAIEPERPIPFRPRRRGLKVDVVLGVRRRQFCPERNWRHWQQLADALSGAGLSFAVIGHRSTSFSLAGQRCHSGDLDTDAALELLDNCRLYVGGDSGNSHLAATVGAPMLIFREEAEKSRDMTGRMQEVCASEIEVLRDCWGKPAVVISAVLNRLSAA